MTEKRKLYPIVVTAKVQITNGDTDGEATFQFPLNKVPTEGDVEEAIKKVIGMIPDDFRLMSRHESMMYFLRNDKGYRGGNLALNPVAEGEKWHDPETENTFSFRDEDDESDEDEE